MTSRTRLDFLLLAQDYHQAFTDAYWSDPSLHSLDYQACSQRLLSIPIYHGDAYIEGLRSRGFTAEQVIPACRPLQLKWADARTFWNPAWWWDQLSGRLPVPRPARDLADQLTLRHILARQIEEYRPEFLWVFSGVPVSARNLRRWRRSARRILLWWSSAIREGFPYHEFDLILTGIPSLLNRFRREGRRVAYLPHAFDARILDRVPSREKRIPRVAFVGSLSPDHRNRMAFLDALSRRVPLDFYGEGAHRLPAGSPLRRSYRGPCWGDALYSVYGSYAIVVHRNIDVANRSPSAKRLFEATGMGACVVVEKSDGLKDLFLPGVEMATYTELDDCATTIEELLREPDRAKDIGLRGQARTLADHTYAQRIDALLRHLKDSEAS